MAERNSIRKLREIDMKSKLTIKFMNVFCFKSVLFSKKFGKWCFIISVLGIFPGIPLQAKEGLNIKSEAGEYSAQIYIQEEEKGFVSEKEKKNDKERKKFGIGETVFLTLTADKPQVIGDPSQIEWIIEEGNSLASFQEEDNSSIKTLIIKSDLSEGGEIVVKAVTEEGREAKIRLSAIVPESISAKHRRKSYDRNHPDFNKRGVIHFDPPNDGDRVMAGASAVLEVTFLPTSVSFNTIQIIERDKGCIPAPADDNLAENHVPNPNPLPLDNKNRIFDYIGSRDLIAKLKFYDLPQTWQWVCDWNIVADGKDVKTVQTVNQSFFHDWIDVVAEIATTTVTKFGCSVSRSTKRNNKHVFTTPAK